MFISLQISVPALSCMVCSREMAKCCAMPASTDWKVSEHIFSTLPLDSKVILGKPFWLILHATEIDLPMQKISLPMVTKHGESVNNVNGIIQNWICLSSWSEVSLLPQQSLHRSTPGLPMFTVVNHPSEFGYFVMNTNWGTCRLTNCIVHGSLQ